MDKNAIFNYVEYAREELQKLIKQKAKEFSSCRKFLASKGWFEKFRKKYNIKVEKYSKHKQL